MIETNVIAHLTRKELFGSQTNLATALGCRPHTICGKRNSKNPLTYEQMRRILAVAAETGLSITPDDFFPELKSQKAA
jgi:hypothetical protein